MRFRHKRHTQFRQPDGSLYHEEVMGIHGFAGIQSILYHLRPPTRVREVEIGAERSIEAEVRRPTAASAPSPPQARRTLPEAGGNAVRRVARLLMSQPGLSRFRSCDPTAAMELLVPLRTRRRDDLRARRYGRPSRASTASLDRTVRATTSSFRPGVHVAPDPAGRRRRAADARRSRAFGHIEPPKRYINNYGQFLEHSPFCERDIRPPERLETIDETGEFEVRVRARGQISRFIYDHHPLDVVGWDGHLWPYAFNIEDFEPITGRIHQPPPVHQTFDGPGFVICSFVPRLFDYHPEAIPAPYNHSNVDSDEVLYYVEGDFMSRKGIDRASFTMHPNGIPHGPHPGTYEASIGKEKTEELAVMVDTFRPLKVVRQAREIEDEGYAYSWLG